MWAGYLRLCTSLPRLQALTPAVTPTSADDQSAAVSQLRDGFRRILALDISSVHWLTLTTMAAMASTSEPKYKRTLAECESSPRHGESASADHRRRHPDGTRHAVGDDADRAQRPQADCVEERTYTHVQWLTADAEDVPLLGGADAQERRRQGVHFVAPPSPCAGRGARACHVQPGVGADCADGGVDAQAGYWTGGPCGDCGAQLD